MCAKDNLSDQLACSPDNTGICHIHPLLFHYRKSPELTGNNPDSVSKRMIKRWLKMSDSDFLIFNFEQRWLDLAFNHGYRIFEIAEIVI